VKRDDKEGTSIFGFPEALRFPRDTLACLPAAEALPRRVDGVTALGRKPFLEDNRTMSHAAQASSRTISTPAMTSVSVRLQPAERIAQSI
jgi:hypothetical protein